MERYVEFIYDDITNQALFRWRRNIPWDIDEAPSIMSNLSNVTDSGRRATLGSATCFEPMLFDMEALPLIIRGRINMLRLVEGDITIPKVGSKSRTGQRLLYVYVDDEDIVDLKKLNPFVVIENYDPLAQ